MSIIRLEVIANISIYYVRDFIPLGIRENEPTAAAAAAANEFQLARSATVRKLSLYLYSSTTCLDILLLRTKPPEREDIVTNAFRVVLYTECVERETSPGQIVALIELNIWMLRSLPCIKSFSGVRARLHDYIIHHNHRRFFLSFCTTSYFATRRDASDTSI
uniref:Uncharacterized protein n=1 Tax=Trichogramma kaykai TaxID=54128 RepID=A0ABD2WBY6_9HYME